MSDGGAVRILGIAGSLRRASFNAALLRLTQELAPAGMTIETFDIAPIPLYNEDVRQQGFPAPVEDLRARIKATDGLLIATPEYNSSVPGALKNALDWGSRPLATNAFRNKPVAVVSSSAGAFGGVWAAAELRKVLGAMGARVTEAELTVGHAHEKLDDDGRLTDDDVRDGLREALELLLAEAAPVSIAA